MQSDGLMWSSDGKLESLCGPSNKCPFNNIVAVFVIFRVMTDLLVVAVYMRFNCSFGMCGVGILLVMDCTGDAADD